MIKKYKMENLDCAVCAAKMEDEIKKISGVKSASISFISQKLTIEADEGDFDAILEKAQKACRKVDAEAEIIF